jgi:hypothetical protein
MVQDMKQLQRLMVAFSLASATALGGAALVSAAPTPQGLANRERSAETRAWSSAARFQHPGRREGGIGLRRK